MNNLNASIIANSFLKRAFAENIKITPLKLNFLVYLLYSDYLLQTNNKLINEWFIRTTTGPTLLSLEAKYGCFKDHSIIKFSKDTVGQVTIISESDKLLEPLLSNIWNNYKNIRDDEIIRYVYQAGLSQQGELEEIITDQEILVDATNRFSQIPEKTEHPSKKRKLKH